MDRAEAQRRFQKADKLYTYGRFEDVLLELETLEQYFPDNHRLLNAKARTLEQLGRHSEALAVCDRLLNNFNYEKIRPIRNRLAETISSGGDAPQRAFWGNEPNPGPGSPAPSAGPDSGDEDKPRRFRIKPIRLLLLLAIIALMYFGYLPYWLGGGLIAAYFILMIAIKVLFGSLVKKIFSAPFKMKGKALAGATCHVHGFQWTEGPAVQVDSEDEEAEGAPDPNLRYAWIEVTITPPEQSEGFISWEPGELMLAPLSMSLKGLDDLEGCFQVQDVKLVVNGLDREDDPGKYEGPQRLKVLVGVPREETAFKFVYYFEQFGEVRLTG